MTRVQVFAAGSYSLIAKVTDSDGNVGLSAPINVSLTGAASEIITWLHNDLGGNTIMASDSLGGTLWKENYDQRKSLWDTPFGDRVIKDATATSNNRQWFAGKPQDSETGLSYFGARYYDPVVGRFMGIDAARFSEGNLHSFNRYAYGNNNPLRFVDPDGNDSIDSIKSFVLAPFEKIALMVTVNQHRESREYGAAMLDGGQWLRASTEGIQSVGDVTAAALSLASLPIGMEAAATRGATRPTTEIVQRWMSDAELNATQESGLLRGGREGTHYVSDAANADPLRARQRLALPQTPEVRVTMEVSGDSLSAASSVRPKYGMSGGGTERTASGSVNAKATKVD